MRLKSLGLLGLTAGSCCGQGVRDLPPKGPPPPYSYNIKTGSYNSSSSLSSSSSSSGPGLIYSSSSSSSSSGPGLIYSSSSSSSSSGPGLIYSSSSYSSGSSSSYPTTHGPYPIGTGTALGTAPKYSSSQIPGTASRSSNSYLLTGTGYPHKPTPHPKCSGVTLNVLNASLDWWYTRTVYDVVSTISVQFNSNGTGWTLLPATTPFDLSSALASPTCTSYWTWNTVFNMSLPDVECTEAPTPVAAGTTVLSQTAYKSLNKSTGTGRAPDVICTPPPAKITIPQSGGTYSEGTAFVYFSAYEIMTKSETTYGNGSVGCAQATQTFNMPEPFSFEYSDGDVNGSSVAGAGVTGDVAPAFLKVVGKTNAKAGSWVAAPTVAVVVQKVVAEELAVNAGPRFSPFFTTTTILQTPSATLPSFNTPPVTKPTNPHHPPPKTTPKVEHTDTNGLQVPTGNGQGKHTKAGGGKPPHGQHGKPPPGGKGKHTKGGEHSGGHHTKGGKLGHLVSVIVSAAKHNHPTNAVQVLSQAVATFKHKSPTAAAIHHGINGHKGNGNPHHGPGNGSPGNGHHENGSPGHGSPGSGHHGNGPPGHGSPGSGHHGNGSPGNGPHGNGSPGSGHHGNGSPGHGSPGNGHHGNGSPVNGHHGNGSPGGGPHGNGSPGNGHHGNGSPANGPHGHGSPGIGSPGDSPIVRNGVGTGHNGKPIVVIGGTTHRAKSKTQFVVGPGKTLTPGGKVVVHGTTVSLAPGMRSVVVNGHTHPANIVSGHPSLGVVTPAPTLTIGGKQFAPTHGPNGPTFHISGHKLTPGGVVIVHGTTISLAPGASSVVVNGMTQNLAGPHPASITAPPTLTIGGQTFTAIHSGNSGDTYVINGKTLTPGELETVSVGGTTYAVSLAPGATALVIKTENSKGQFVGTSTEMLPPGAAVITAPPVLTIGSHTYSAINRGPTYVINGETLTPGEVETVSVGGTTYIVSLAPGATVLEIKTEGPNGKATATTFETLHPGVAGQATVTNTVSAGGKPSSGPSQSAGASNGASSLVPQLSGICIALASFALAVWL